MLGLNHRSKLKEYLDEDNILFEDIKQNLIELNTINTFLGGHKITCDGAIQFSIDSTSQVVEIGCGGGDNLAYLRKQFLKSSVSPKLIGIDMKQECIEFGKQQYPNIQFHCSDYRNVVFNKKPDVIFSSLFCHHFYDDELVSQLQWMKLNVVQGFFINDLQRHWLAYWSIKLLTLFFSKSYLVKHDAPLSVTRGFKRKEWEAMLERAGITNYSIKWKWAFRYLIVVKHEG